MGTVIEFADSLSIFVWTYLLRAAPFGMAVIPVFTLGGFVGRAIVIVYPIIIASLAVLLIVSDPASLQNLRQTSDSVSITTVESVSSELSHFSISHLFGLFDLLRVELDLGWVDSV